VGLHMVSKHSTTELHFQFNVRIFKKRVIQTYDNDVNILSSWI
jgi:hypothetical protein